MLKKIMGENEMNLPSLIILKNSIISGKKPGPENLEIGELALTLFKGEEGIWAKNSEGEVINLRIPDTDLFWEDLLRSYNTKEEFEADLEEGQVNLKSIVFIKQEKLIWSDNVYYGDNNYSEEEIKTIIKEFIVTIPETISSLTTESSNEDILVVFESIENFQSIYNKTKTLGGTISNLTIDNEGNIPISIIPGKDNVSLEISWTYKKKYEYINIILEDTLLRVESRTTIDFDKKQDILVSGENIKTINGISILGPGNLNIEGTGGGGSKTYIGGKTETAEVIVDNELNTITAKVLPEAINSMISPEDVDRIFDETFKPLEEL